MNQKIKFIRKKLHLTEKEISSLLNISSYKYSFFEKKEVDIPCEILLLLSKIYGININLLVYAFFDKQELLYELERQGLTTNNRTDTLQKLNVNLFSNKNTKTTYRSVKKIQNAFQDNIAKYIKNQMNIHGLSLKEFSILCNIEEASLSSILSKRRFIKTTELIKISNYFQTPIDSIIND